MVSPKLEMRRTAGKLALLLAGVYLLVVFGLVVSTLGGNPIPPLGWVLALVPAAAFVYSVIDAIELHRTSDDATSARLWRRSLLLAAVGLASTIAVVVVINRITPV